MLRVYFDDELIDVDAYTELDNEYKLFTDTFKLGSVASNTFKLSVLKTAVNSQPINVRIEDDDTVMNFVVDNVTEDDYVYAYTLTDKLLNFNFNYDASELINSKVELEEDCYLSDIWKDMCLQAGVEYDDAYVFENDIVVNWYDNRVQARRYLSYIAELQSGYAYIKEDGKQSFKKQNRSSVKTIDADEVSDLIVGEKKKITRVVYDGGAFKWEFGDETGDTLYLQNENVFIVNEEIVENIYNNIKDFEFYIIDVPQAPMDSTIKAGDIITFDDNGKLYPTIAQYTMSYAGGWTGGYKLSVNTDKQQETNITRVADNVRNLQVNVNRIDNEFSVVAEEIGENSLKITEVEQTVYGITTKIEEIDEIKERTTSIEEDIEGLSVELSSIGGYNLLENCVKQFGQASWTGDFYNLTNTEIKNNSLSKSALVFQNGEDYREVFTENGEHNFSFKYKKLIPNAITKITINNNVIPLDTSNEWMEVDITIPITNNQVQIKFESDTDGAIWLVDVLLIRGTLKQLWTPNPNEINTGVIRLGGDTLTIESNTASTLFEATTDGTRVKNTDTLERVAEFTKDGVWTNHIEGNSGNIANVTFNEVGNQTWIGRG